jgi:hypothetical protein
MTTQTPSAVATEVWLQRDNCGLLPCSGQVVHHLSTMQVPTVFTTHSWHSPHTFSLQGAHLPHLALDNGRNVGTSTSRGWISDGADFSLTCSLRTVFFSLISLVLTVCSALDTLGGSSSGPVASPKLPAASFTPVGLLCMDMVLVLGDGGGGGEGSGGGALKSAQESGFPFGPARVSLGVAGDN